MACDLSALDQIDTSDPGQLDSLMQECTSAIFSPELWAWAIGLTVAGAIVGAWIGRKRNSMLRDALLGAALGPVGWVISLRLAKRPAERKCPGCGVVVAESDAYCRNCGRKLLR